MLFGGRAREERVGQRKGAIGCLPQAATDRNAQEPVLLQLRHHRQVGAAVA
jgi:hypothetical protein